MTEDPARAGTGAPAAGRRERKKAATRKAISDAATRLFLERGFDEVSIREIADVADVSPTTVFAHFPQKEALVFDEDEEQRDELVAIVRDRPAGTGILEAFQAAFHRGVAEQAAYGRQRRAFLELVDSTPALNDYAARMWLRHEQAVAAAVAQDLGRERPDDAIRVLARFVLQIQLLALESEDPAAALDTAFALLAPGWAELEGRAGRAG
ncbi:TetR/AcrR family transcriptional regulator [Homoserinibacter sp. YIM 151385]|uniref:TetR/AcrR family transcriptional regulator n=1 Tax=Homoserinibacter sp. YIM 151385 TaxID=2985506 RepID=UPI0022F0E613|nr:TetR/AcrR family transcriptional regulator [Homoserinibacter sp. YIM 151385]WBU37600.1 helix-turn-helix domain containing protein [Homoserinibacter sp. YIM 151385]